MLELRRWHESVRRFKGAQEREACFSADALAAQTPWPGPTRLIKQPQTRAGQSRAQPQAPHL
jgi:hypothetical protein